VPDVDDYAVIVHVATVEELPVAVVLVDHEQDRQLAPVDCRG
jgi:hypothetical protein